MKNILFVLWLFCVKSSFGSETATNFLNLKQTDTVPVVTDTTNAKMQDYVTVQGGKVIIVKNKVAKPIDSDVTMHDGSVVRKDGTLISKDGKTHILHEGDKVYMSGITEAPKLE